MNRNIVTIGGEFIALSIVALTIGVIGYSFEMRREDYRIGLSLGSFWLFFVALGVFLLIIGLLVILRGVRPTKDGAIEPEQTPIPVSQKLCPKCETDITLLAICPKCGYVVKTK